MFTLKTLFSIIAQKKRYGKSKVFVVKKKSLCYNIKVCCFAHRTSSAVRCQNTGK